MSLDTRSFTSTAPHQRTSHLYEAQSAYERGHCLLRTGSRPSAALHTKNREQDLSQDNEANLWNVAISSDVANSHFQRRNQLEARLVELQKDAGSLALNLRFNGNYKPSLGLSSPSITPKKPEEERESCKKPTTVKPRLKGIKEQLVEAKKGGDSAVKTLRELYDVTIERDQLKLELARTKRALAAASKQCEDAGKRQRAYDELVVHCGSLQKSLDLSERDRVRQKKLLQQLQSQQGQMTAKNERETTKKGVTSVKARSNLAGDNSMCRCTDTALPQLQEDSSARGYTRVAGDKSNSGIAPGQPNEKKAEEDQEAPLEQAASESTAADTRPKAPRTVLEFTTPKAEHLQGKKCLQQSDSDVDSQHPGQIAANTYCRPSQAQARLLKVRRQSATSARSPRAAVKIPTPTTQLARRRTTNVVRPKNAYLAPTQSSLRRLHELPRRETRYRPPFVV